MAAIWDVHAIAAMNQEQRIRNLCRQIRQEACDWGRGFAGPGGCNVRRWQDGAGDRLPGGVTLLLGGRRGRAWVVVERDEKPVSRKFRFTPNQITANEAAELYTAIMEAAELPTPCTLCGRPVEALERFPGGICLACHAKSQDGKPLERPDFAGTVNV